MYWKRVVNWPAGWNPAATLRANWQRSRGLTLRAGIACITRGQRGVAKRITVALETRRQLAGGMESRRYVF